MSSKAYERKAEQRRRDQLIGYTEVSIRVARDQVEGLRNYASTLPAPPSFEERIQAAADRARDEILEVYDLASEYEGSEIDPAKITSDPVALAILGVARAPKKGGRDQSWRKRA